MGLRHQAHPNAAASATGSPAGAHAGMHSSLPPPCRGLVQDKGPVSRKPEPSPLSSHQILKWPQPRALGQAVTKTMVNTVVANPTFTYLTALTDSNIVAIWRKH